jgi:hypothetical protein
MKKVRKPSNSVYLLSWLIFFVVFFTPSREVAPRFRRDSNFRDNFQFNLSLQSSGSKSRPSKKTAKAGGNLGSLFDQLRFRIYTPSKRRDLSEKHAFTIQKNMLFIWTFLNWSLTNIKRNVILKFWMLREIRIRVLFHEWCSLPLLFRV